MLILDLAIASVAAILSVLSFRTLKAIKHLGVGKSFWIPISMSGLLFLAGSFLAILNELGFAFIAYTDEVVQATEILALLILVAGVYNYSKTISKSLLEKFAPPKRLAQVDIQTKAPPTPISTTAAPDDVPIQERLAQESRKMDTVQDCPYQFGYLGTLPRGTPIPDECLRCDKIIQCKHSPAKALNKPVESSSN